jgi:hypothetical protein
VEDKKPPKQKLVGTYFRNGLKSNLDLTTLADTKAGILISVNGFILTVIMTASGFVVHNKIMNFAFASIILTALLSIILAAFAIRPRTKETLLKKDERVDNYSSLLYYDDMAKMHPKEFIEETEEVIKSFDESAKHLTLHLHILGVEIKKKYFWLKQAYTYFSIGLMVSVFLAVYGLIFIEQTPFNTISSGTAPYKRGEFENIFEPSGVVQLPDGKILIVEDEPKRSFSILEFRGDLLEREKLKMSSKIKQFFKKEVDDFEAVTIDGNRVYAITSHSLTKSGENLEKRNRVVSFQYIDGEVKNLITFNRLKESLNSQFPDIFNRSVLRSVNIEGLAFNSRKETLLIGFRSPTDGENALLIEILNPKEMFHKNPIFGRPFSLNMNGLGVRDLFYDEDKKGFWIVGGSPKDREKREFELWFYSDSGELKRVENQPKIGFTEGITVVKSDDNRTKLLLVEDNGKRPNSPANYITVDRSSL